MSIPIPPSKPQAPVVKVLAAAEKQWRKDGKTGPLPAKFILAVRAYYRDSMGEVGKNDLNQYDDGFFIVDGDKMTSWNGNTDPVRLGWNADADGYMARLHTGCWKMRSRMHRNKYQAFGQDGKDVSVDRVKADGTVAEVDTGSFGIDLHPGGVNTTSSLGCQTVPRDQWDDFNETALATFGGDWFDYILTDGPIN